MSTERGTTTSTPTDLLAVAEEVARAAGGLVREHRPDEVEVAGTKSSRVDVVTQMDMASEDLLRTMLRRLRPEDGILGEEDGLSPGTTGLTWVVDPIDGTVNYMYGIPAYAVSVAVVTGDPLPHRWTVQAGCVHSVSDGRTWTAARGHGAYLDGRRLQVRPSVPLAESLVGTGFGYRAARRREQARVLTGVLPRVRDVRRIGSAALDLCAVASGQLDGYYERGLQPWDLAAGALVAAEAGAVVRGLRGAAAGEPMTVAGAPATCEALVGLLEELQADGEEAGGALG